MDKLNQNIFIPNYMMYFCIEFCQLYFWLTSLYKLNFTSRYF